MTSVRCPRSTPRSRPDPVAARRWLLEVVETPDGVLALDGLPEDRETRLSVLYRLRDVIAAACHLDDAHGEGDGALCRRYAARQFAVAISRPRSVSWSSWWPRMRTPSAPRRAEPDQQ
jgi:hypothetical protein